MASIALKIKSKKGQQVLRNLTSSSTVAELKTFLQNITEIDADKLIVMFGYPLQPLDISNEAETLAAIGLTTGETLTVEEKKSIETPKRTQIEDQNKQEFNLPKGTGILMKQVVPSDNSCLFTSIGYVINGKIDTSIGSMMRQIIASEVASDPETYNDAFLGKSNREYCEWIQLPNSWGGAIEVSVLSRYYGLEMDVVDTLNAIINRFGEDKNYGQRVFLLFDGIHYDPLYLEMAEGGIQTIFPSENLDVYKEAEQLAHEAKSSRQFTDLNKFTLKCMQCDKLLIGQTEAQKHAVEAGHTKFGEV